jgi:hypothetical protein
MGEVAVKYCKSELGKICRDATCQIHGVTIAKDQQEHYERGYKACETELREKLADEIRTAADAGYGYDRHALQVAENIVRGA